VARPHMQSVARDPHMCRGVPAGVESQNRV
jgi:hypothetical protein